ncbi:MAG: aminoacyl-tRNA hydrolase [Magnetococcales bacterium]|nr:aminoacyl-tRNA hydrolase [Magnetococcales bacterium]
MIAVNRWLQIPEAEITYKFIRSSGPGGQNVNKVASAVQLKFNARNSTVLTHGVYMRLKTLAGSRMTQDGFLIITSEKYRTQDQNRKEAVERLVAFIEKALVPPKLRRATKPTKASKQRRLDGKNKRSNVKKNRGKVVKFE